MFFALQINLLPPRGTIMQRMKIIPIRLLLVSVIMVSFTACAAMGPSNVGKTALTKEIIPISGQAAADRLWQANDVSVNYSINSSKDTFSISGSVVILDNVLASFPMAETFYLYFTFVDENGLGLSTHNISPLVRYRTEVSKSLSFRKNLIKPDGAVSYVFSYRGTFKSGFGAEQTSEDWEIFYRPFIIE